jgi:hypothetical protein
LCVDDFPAYYRFLRGNHSCASHCSRFRHVILLFQGKPATGFRRACSVPVGDRRIRPKLRRLKSRGFPCEVCDRNTSRAILVLPVTRQKVRGKDGFAWAHNSCYSRNNPVFSVASNDIEEQYVKLGADLGRCPTSVFRPCRSVLLTRQVCSKIPAYLMCVKHTLAANPVATSIGNPSSDISEQQP